MNTEIGKWRRRKKRKKPQKISICRSFVARVRAHAPPRSFVIHGERERERDASTRRRQLVAKTEGEQTVGLLIVIHSPPPPAIIIIKFRAHNHSNGHQRPGGSGGRRARVTRSPTAQRAHRRHTRVHELTTPARTRRRMKRRKERRE